MNLPPQMPPTGQPGQPGQPEEPPPPGDGFTPTTDPAIGPAVTPAVDATLRQMYKLLACAHREAAAADKILHALRLNAALSRAEIDHHSPEYKEARRRYHLAYHHFIPAQEIFQNHHRLLAQSWRCRWLPPIVEDGLVCDSPADLSVMKLCESILNAVEAKIFDSDDGQGEGNIKVVFEKDGEGFLVRGTSEVRRWLEELKQSRRVVGLN